MLIKTNPNTEVICRRIATLSGEVDRGNFSSDKELFFSSLGTIMCYCTAMLAIYYLKSGIPPENIKPQVLRFFAGIESEHDEMVTEILKGMQ